MSKFEKPKTVYVSDNEYINNLVNANLKKDLHDNEEICPWCHGTGLAIEDNEYGLSDDPKNNIMRFPYKHQSLSFCTHCYNGIVHRCKLCGEIMPRGRLTHDCDQQKEIDRKIELEKSEKIFNDAIEFSPESLDMDKFGMCFSNEYPYDNGYFSEWDEFFDYWSSDCEDDERPVYVWGTESQEIKIDAYDTIEYFMQDIHEDAINYIPDEKINELQEFLDKWCKECRIGPMYFQSTKCKVKIPWEIYDKEYK